MLLSTIEGRKVAVVPLNAIGLTNKCCFEKLLCQQDGQSMTYNKKHIEEAP